VLTHRRGDRHTQDVLRSLAPREQSLIDGMTTRQVSLPPNREIVGAGEVGAGLFIVLEGWAFRYCRTGAGCRQIVDFLLPGEIIGLQAALLGMYEHSVRSLTAVRLSRLEPRLVGTAFETAPELALRFARHIAAEARRVEALMTAMGCRDALGRLAFLALSLYQRQAAADPADCPFPLRRQHLADALGLTGAHVNRTLNRMRLEGVATIERGRLAIQDLARLTELAGTAA
jgi:CRP/FNR family transcriptional regulator, anaerobic regulatory protein